MPLKSTTVQLVSYISGGLKRRLQEVAKAKDMSASVITREAVRKEVERLEAELANPASVLEAREPSRAVEQVGFGIQPVVAESSNNSYAGRHPGSRGDCP